MFIQTSLAGHFFQWQCPISSHTSLQGNHAKVAWRPLLLTLHTMIAACDKQAWYCLFSSSPRRGLRHASELRQQFCGISARVLPSVLGNVRNAYSWKAVLVSPRQYMCTIFVQLPLRHSDNANHAKREALPLRRRWPVVRTLAALAESRPLERGSIHPPHESNPARAKSALL